MNCSKDKKCVRIILTFRLFLKKKREISDAKIRRLDQVLSDKFSDFQSAQANALTTIGCVLL